jgi:CRP/FNR family transcriptional regulator, anaerobic regulatory protein
MNACTQCAVRDAAICHTLSESELGEFSGMGRHQTLKRGQTMLWEGDDSLLVGNVIEGVLKLSISTVEGREQTLGLLFPSDFIGRPFGPTTNHSVVALTDAKVCTFRRTGFDDYARRHPDLEHGLLQRTLTELDRTRQWMALLGRKSATARVASFLLEMASRARCAGLAEQEGSVRQDIADLLGLTIETVSRQITSLREEGIIATPSRRTIDVLDRERLVDRAGEV